MSVTDIVKKQSKKIHEYANGTNRMKSLTVLGAGLGLGSTLVNGEDDNLPEILGDTVVGAGVGVGSYASLNDNARESLKANVHKGAKQVAEDIENVLSQTTVSDISEADLENKAKPKTQVTPSDVNKIDGEIKTESSFSKIKENARHKNNMSKMKVAGAIGLTAFAFASVLDTKDELKQDVRTERMKGEQESNLIKKKNREKEVMSQYQRGGPTDFGSVAFDMFNDRIGHHLMGNAKYQK
jgi:hypothetical protein